MCLLAALGVLLLAGCSGGGGGGGGGGPIVLPTQQAQLVEPPKFSAGNAPVDSGGVGSGAHPNLFLNQNELNDIFWRAADGEEPITTHLSLSIQGARSRSAPRPEEPGDVYQGTNATLFRSAFDPDAEHALSSAIAAQFPAFHSAAERQIFLANVRDTLVSWARNSLAGVSSINDLCASGECERFNAGLFLSVGLLGYVAAYDLIHDDPVLSASDHAEIRAWLGKIYDLIRAGTDIWGGGPAAGGPAVCHRYSNHATHHIAAMAAIAYVLDDASRIRDSLEGAALRYNWSTLLRDTIYMAGDPALGCEAARPTFTGEMYDRYRHFDVPGVNNDPNADPSTWNDGNRGYGYALESLTNLAFVAEMALHRGRDLYRTQASSGEALDLPGQYYSTYKELVGPGRRIIVASGYPGESSYVGEVMKDGYNGIFELLSKRYHHDADIIRALEPYDQLAVTRRWFNPLFFGRIYDPSRQAWDFHLDGMSEGWELLDASQVSAAGVRDGVLWLDSAGSDPAVEIRDLYVAAEKYGELVLRMRVSVAFGSAAPGPAELSWQTESGSSDGVSFTHQADGAMREYRIPLRDFPSWNTLDNRITQLRLDPVSRPGLEVEIDSIHLEID